MRFQKLLLLFLVVSLSLSLAFSQTALSVRKSASKGYDTPYQMRLDAQADAADARAKEAEFRAAAAKISMQELQRLGDQGDRRNFSQKQLDLKAEIATAELDAAQARSEALRSRVDLVRDQANVASKTAADPTKDKKAQAKYYDALWLQQLAAKSEKEVVKADEEVSRKNKIAVEATRKAEASAQEMVKAEAKEAARQSKLAGKEIPKNSSYEAEVAKAAEAPISPSADKELARKAKAEQETARKAEEMAAKEQTKADRIAAQNAKAEFEEKKRAQEQEAALKEEVAKSEARRVKAEQDASHKAQEMAAVEKAQADREAARQAKADQAALLKAQSDQAQNLQSAEAEQKTARKAQEIAAAEKAKADREVEKQAKLDQEALKKAQAREVALQEDAAKESARRIKVEQENARKAQELAAADKAKSERESAQQAAEAARMAKENQAKKLMAEKDAQAASAKLAKAEAERQKMAKVASAPAPVVILTAADSSNDPLLELLRKKQQELDAQETLTPIKAMVPSEPKKMKVDEVRVKEVETVKKTASTSSRPEDFFRAKEVVSSSPKIVPVIAPELIKVAAAPVAKVQPAAKETLNPVAITANAPDTGAQDNLVEILRRKQIELDKQEAAGKMPQPAPTAPVAPIVRQPAKPVLEPKISPEVTRPPQAKIEVSKPVAVISQPVIAPEKQDELLEIIRKKQMELDAKERTTVMQKAPAVEIKKPIVSESIAAQEREKSNERIRQIEAEIKAKEDAIKKSIAQPAPVQPAPLKKPVKSEEAPKAVVPAKIETKTQPVRPPTVTTGSKEDRLSELLRKYKSDQITPHDYHIERAKILAEP